MTLSEWIQEREEQVKELQKITDATVSFLLPYKEQLDALDVAPAPMSASQIDFDNLPHYKVIKLMQIFKAGKWNKEVNTNRTSIDYSTTINGINIRCWAGEPPPQCKLVRETVIIPAQWVPEHTEEKIRMQCTEELNEPKQVEGELASEGQVDEVPF